MTSPAGPSSASPNAQTSAPRSLSSPIGEHPNHGSQPSSIPMASGSDRPERSRSPGGYSSRSSVPRAIRTARSWTSQTSHTSRREHSNSNWRTLQDLVAESEDEDETDPLRGRGSTSRDPLQRRDTARSYRSLRSFFSQQSPVSSNGAFSRPISISQSGQSGEGESRSIVDVLSTSPGSIDTLGQSVNSDASTIRPGRLFKSPGSEASTRPAPLSNGNGFRSPVAEPLLSQKPSASVSAQARKTSTVKKFWPPSPVVIAILKSAISYLVASLFTFVPALANLLSVQSEIDAHGRVTPKPAYSAHMVATIVVYFNPAKTVGNMFLASRFCGILAVFATIISLLAMGTVHLFDFFSPSQGSEWDWISEIGDWMVCVLWIGGSMGCLAWLKVWVANPVFNSGCSMAAVTLYTVVIKEGAIPKLLEVLLIVLIGAVITNLTCYLIFPTSATSRLQDSISNSLTSFSTLLDMLTSTFLLKQPSGKGSQTTLKAAIKSHAAAFKTLKSDLAEAKHERVIDPRIRGKRLVLYDAAIESLTRLAQHLASLRGSTRLQESLIQASKDGRIHLDLQDGSSDGMTSATYDVTSPQDGPSGRNTAQTPEDKEIQSNVKLFLQFRSIAGKEMDTLVDYCEDALEAVQAITQQKVHNTTELSETRSNLAIALRDFNRSSSKAIRRVYAGPRRKRGVYHSKGHSSSSEESSDEERDGAQADYLDDPDGLDGPNETVFLVYFFLFTLEEFARETLYLLDTVNEIVDAEGMSTTDYLRSLWPSKRKKQEKRTNYLYKRFRQIVPVDPSQLQPPLFPRNARDERGTLLTPLPFGMPFWAKVKQRFWEFGDWLRQPSIRYALKTGIGGALLAAPAYTETGRPIFLEYRGEWALISYFSAISPTVGQTNFLSFFRVVGTLIGATVAVLCYTAFPENNVVLPILGVIFSIPCFYVITQMPDYAQAARFTLLTYNLTCLYAYNSRERDVSALSIAFHRSTSVIIGVIWAAVVSRYWWPFTARRELRMGLSDFCLDLSYLYSKLVTTYSRGVDPPEAPIVPENGAPVVNGEEEPLLPVGNLRHPHLNAGVRQFMAMELHLQSQLNTLRGLLAQTKNEPRLKGPFAFDFYQEVLLSCERMLDRLHSMRCVTTRDEWDNGIRKAFVAPVNRERREMAGNVILYFYTLSAGFRLRTPMPPYLPPAEHARVRLVEAIRNLDVVKRRSVRGGGRHLLFFAYALAMQEVIAELESLGRMLQEAFGVISQSTVVDFESLFQASQNA